MTKTEIEVATTIATETEAGALTTHDESEPAQLRMVI